MNFKVFRNFLWGCFLFTSLAFSEPQHGISLYGDLKYPKDFKHFEYVNPQAPKGGTFTQGVVGTFDSLNPFVIKGVAAAGLSYLYPSYIYATLTAPSADEPFSRYGYAAESIEKDPDNLWVIFTLREGMTFHDGSPLTARDVIYSFNTLVQKGLPLYKSYYTDVKEVVQLDKRRIKFIFKHGNNKELALILGDFPILSKAFLEKNGFDKNPLRVPLGNGPYKIVKVEPGHSVTYERVKNWWGEKLPLHQGRHNFDQIKIIYFRDDSVKFEAFKAGDYLFQVENVAKRWAIEYDFPAVKEGKIVREEIPFKSPAVVQALVFNTRRPIFQNRKVREALGYAFDFEWTNANLFYHTYQRLKSYFDNSELGAKGRPEGDVLKILEAYRGRIPDEALTQAFEPPKTDGSSQDRKNLLKARQLLKEAGYIFKNGEMISEKTGKTLVFEILINAEPKIQRVLIPFLQNLKRLGVQATLRMVETSQYTRRVQEYDFDMTWGLYPQSLSPGNEQREFWSSKVADIPGGRNLAGIKDPVVDELVERVINASTRQGLIHATQALDRVLLWGHYVIPLYYLPVERVAYYKQLKHPEKLPPYQLDLEAWWWEGR